MTIAPLPLRRNTQAGAGGPGSGAGGARNFNARTLRPTPSARNMARRRLGVNLAKRLLPLAALALLASLVLWPEIQRQTGGARLAFRSKGISVDGGALVDAQYNGVDARDRPYTMTAAVARQVTPDRIDMTDIKADLGGGEPGWLMIQSKNGVYNQHSGQLDMSGDVRLYRDDGTTLLTDSAAVDLKAGAAAGAEKVHVEGPFGQLDAQGFALTDRGAVIQFTGPGRLILNGRKP